MNLSFLIVALGLVAAVIIIAVVVAVIVSVTHS